MSRAPRELPPGIYPLPNGGFRVKVAVGDRKHGGQQRETTFPKRTALRTMTDWQTQTRAALKRQRLVPVTGTLEADAARYVETKATELAFPSNRKYELAAWMENFGHRRRHTVTEQDIEDQIQRWKTAGVAASTIRHRLSALSDLYRTLDKRSGHNPVAGVERPPEPKPKTNDVPLSLIVKVLDELWFRSAMNNRGWKTLARALVLAHTGMRPSQLMRVDSEMNVRPFLNAPQPFAQVPSGKDGNPVELPLNMFGVDAFRLFLRVGAAGSFSTQAFYKSWMLACDRANVQRFNPYRLRHSFATLHRRAGADLADVQEMLGHTTSKVTQRYAHVVPEKLAASAQRTEEMWRQARGERAWVKPQPTEKKASSGT